MIAVCQVRFRVFIYIHALTSNYIMSFRFTMSHHRKLYFEAFPFLKKPARNKYRSDYADQIY